VGPKPRRHRLAPQPRARELFTGYAAALDERDAALATLQAIGAFSFDKICADRMADEIDVLIKRRVIDSRSPAADALLDYREPPRTSRSDRMALLEDENARLRAMEAHLIE